MIQNQIKEFRAIILTFLQPLFYFVNNAIGLTPLIAILINSLCLYYTTFQLDDAY